MIREGVFCPSCQNQTVAFIEDCGPSKGHAVLNDDFDSVVDDARCETCGYVDHLFRFHRPSMGLYCSCPTCWPQEQVSSK